jgi:hypothetical protein
MLLLCYHSHAQSIHSALDVILGLTGLALNAAIEAARAKEQGRRGRGHSLNTYISPFKI